MPHFTASVAALFETLAPEQLAQQIAASSNAGNTFAMYWLERFVDVPASKAPLKELVDAAPWVELGIAAVLSPERRIAWRYAYREPEGTPEQQARYPYALAMLRVVEAGLLPHLRRCRAKDCRRFFFGDPRSRWCSSACGSKERQKKKRRLARQKRGAL